jgi:hypothetical protein
MKRVTLNIDLKENEVFDEEVQNIIRAKVREIVRNEFDVIVTKTASEEVERLFKADTFGYKHKLNDIVKRGVTADISTELKRMDVDKSVREKIEEMIDYKINWYSSMVEEKTKTVLETMVTSEVASKLKGIFGKDAD